MPRFEVNRSGKSVSASGASRLRGKRSGSGQVNTLWQGSVPVNIIPTGGSTGSYAESGVSYKSAIFNATGTFVVEGGPVSAQVLVVAGGGGGGGGSNADGGGGAGGLRTTTLTLNDGVTYTATVGNGGANFASGGNSSVSGSDISTFSSSGGGRGGQGDVANSTATAGGSPGRHDLVTRRS